MLIPDKRIAEVVSRLTGVPVVELRVSGDTIECPTRSFDSLDTLELIMELEEDFDKETVQWARRYLRALVERAGLTRYALQTNPRPTSPTRSGTQSWMADPGMPMPRFRSNSDADAHNRRAGGRVGCRRAPGSSCGSDRCTIRIRRMGALHFLRP